MTLYSLIEYFEVFYKRAMPLSDEQIAALYNDPRTGLKGEEAFIKQVRAEHPDVKPAQIRRVLQGLDTYALNKARYQPAERKRVVVRTFLEVLACDLADMQRYADENDGYRFILISSDVLSGRIWAEPLKNKEARTTAAAMKRILDRLPKQPVKVWTDSGAEFKGAFAKLLEDSGIVLYHTQNEGKCAPAENRIRVLKGRIGRGADARGNWRWVDRLQDYVQNINETPHKVTKRRPIDVTEANQDEVAATKYSDIDELNYRVVKQAEALDAKPKFKPGQYVRISLLKTDRFAKESQVHRWSRQPFLVVSVTPGPPVVQYELADVVPGKDGQTFDRGDTLEGTFYESELSKWVPPLNDEYPIIIKERRGNRALVGWVGFDKSFDRWVPASQVRDLA